MLAVMFPALLLLPSGTITGWATDELTVSFADTRIAVLAPRLLLDAIHD